MKRFAMIVAVSIFGVAWTVAPAVAGDVHMRVGINLGGCNSSRVCSPCGSYTPYYPYSNYYGYGYGYGGYGFQSPSYYIHRYRHDPLGFQDGLRTLYNNWQTRVYVFDGGRRNCGTGHASRRISVQQQVNYYKADHVKKAWNDYKYDPRLLRNGVNRRGQAGFGVSSNARRNASVSQNRSGGGSRGGRRPRSRRSRSRSRH